MLKNILKRLVPKNMARKPLPKADVYLKFGFVITECENQHCPRCNHILNAGPNYQCKYCDQCGQKIDFSGIIWKKDKCLGYAERKVIG